MAGEIYLITKNEIFALAEGGERREEIDKHLASSFPYNRSNLCDQLQRKQTKRAAQGD